MNLLEGPGRQLAESVAPAASGPLRVLLVTDASILEVGLRAALRQIGRPVRVEASIGPPDRPTPRGAPPPDLIVVAQASVARTTIAALRQTRSEAPIAVIVDDPDPDAEELLALIRSGASAVLSASIGPTDLGPVIERLLAGETLVHDMLLERPEVAARVLGMFRQLAADVDQVDRYVAPVTQREREILGLIVEGLSNGMIAARLAISEQTVKNHTSSILRKLSVSDRTAAAVFAIRAGWAPLHAADGVTGSRVTDE